MAEPTLTPLFHPQHVQAIADRLGHADWDFLQSKSFRGGLEDIERKRLTGEANTREKIIEPILYEVLGFDRNENDAEHAVQHAGSGGETGSVEYYFLVPGNHVPLEAKSWGKSLDEKDSSGRTPVRQGFEYAAFSSLRWFIVTNGTEWRLYKTQLKGSQSPLSACERYLLKDLLENRRAFLRFHATFSRGAFLPNRDGVSRLDDLRRQNEDWQQEIGESLYKKLVDARLLLYREIQPQFQGLPQEDVNNAVVKLAAVIASGKPPTDHEDYEIEKRVMQLYGLTRSMCRRIFEVLHQVQKLRVIREMNIAEPDMLLDALPE